MVNLQKISKHFIKTFLILFFITSSLFASNKDAQKLANYLASSYFDLDMKTVEEISTTFLQDNITVKGFYIEEDSEVVFVAHKMNNQIMFLKDLPKGFQKLKNFSSNISYKGYTIGKIHLFYVDYSDVLNLQLTAQEKEYIKNKKSITMCVDPNWMPYEKIENGKYIGIGSEYINIFEKKLNIEFKLIKTNSWEESKAKARTKECEVLPLSSASEKRKEFMNVTAPYLVQPLVLATKIDSKFITDIRELKGKKIGITKGYAIIDLLKEKYPFLEIIETENLKDGLQRVKDGNLFGQIDAILTLNYSIQNFFLDELKISSKLEEQYKLGIASNKDDMTLHNIFVKLINTITQKEHNTIYKNWTLNNKVVHAIDHLILLQIFLVFLTIIIAIMFWNYRLKKTVEAKTKELKILNDNLEQKVALEVKKNRQNQISLLEQAKMAALGEMIGNIAHQWRQPLSAISSSASSMELQNSLDSLDKQTISKYCQSINKKSQYLSSTIDDFRNFIKGESKEEKFNLSQAINSFLTLVESSIKKYEIKVLVNISDKIEITGLKNELNQCLLNFFNNSKDAFLEKSIENKLIFIDASLKNNRLLIEFYDNAQGIEEQIIEKVFEPYFTTKHQSQGTGLGLNMTYRLITEGMDGKLWVENKSFSYEDENYLGASFKIVLNTKS